MQNCKCKSDSEISYRRHLCRRGRRRRRHRCGTGARRQCCARTPCLPSSRRSPEQPPSTPPPIPAGDPPGRERGLGRTDARCREGATAGPPLPSPRRCGEEGEGGGGGASGAGQAVPGGRRRGSGEGRRRRHGCRRCLLDASSSPSLPQPSRGRIELGQGCRGGRRRRRVAPLMQGREGREGQFPARRRERRCGESRGGAALAPPARCPGIDPGKRKQGRPVVSGVRIASIPATSSRWRSSARLLWRQRRLTR
jgi:hypothetical protein